jgi:hypothetical protein
MKRTVATLVVLIIVILATSCSATSGNKPTITPDEAFAITKIGVRSSTVLLISSRCKDGIILDVPCDVALAQSGSIVDTIANDFRPGMATDSSAREATRAAVSVQVARAIHPYDFATDDAEAKTRQAVDVASVRVLVDLIGNLIVAALGK